MFLDIPAKFNTNLIYILYIYFISVSFNSIPSIFPLKHLRSIPPFRDYLSATPNTDAQNEETNRQHKVYCPFRIITKQSLFASLPHPSSTPLPRTVVIVQTPEVSLSTSTMWLQQYRTN